MYLPFFLLTAVHTQYPLHLTSHINLTLLCLLSIDVRRYKRKYSLLHEFSESNPCSYGVSGGNYLRNEALKTWHNKIANKGFIYSTSDFPYQYISSNVPPKFIRLP